MPTLLRYRGYKFFFYANDHIPAHVHIMKGGCWAKIELATLKVVYSSFKPAELAECLKQVELHQKEFQEKWNEWFCR